MTNIICWAVLVIPWLIIPLANVANQTRIPKEMFIDFLCMVLLVRAFQTGTKWVYRNKWLSYFVGYVFFTAFWNWYYPMLFSWDNKVYYNIWTVPQYIHFIFISFTTFIVLSILEKEDFEKIAKYFCWAGIMVSVFTIMQWLNIDPWGARVNYLGPNHCVALLDNPNTNGNYLALLLPFYFYFKKPLYLIGVILLCIALLLTDSMVSIVAVAGMIVVFLLLNYRHSKKILWTLGTLSVAILLGFIISPATNHLHNHFHGRFEIWEQTYKFIKTNPLWGRGLGVFKTFGVHIGNVMCMEAHSDWIERVLELGLVGTGLLVMVVINSIKNFNYKVDNKLGIVYFTSFIGFLGIMLFAFPMEIGAIALTGLISFWAVEKL